MAAQSSRSRNCFSVMKWTNDGNRLSVHHLKYIIEPKQDFDLYNTGDVGLAVYPGYPGHWAFVILAVGESKSEMENWLSDYLMNSEETGVPKSQKKGKQATKSNQELGEAKWLKKRISDRQSTTKTSAKMVPENARESSPQPSLPTACNISSGSAKKQPITNKSASTPKAKMVPENARESSPQPTACYISSGSAKKQPTTQKSASTPKARSVPENARESSPKPTACCNISTGSAKKHGTPAKIKESADTDEIPRQVTPIQKNKHEHPEEKHVTPTKKMKCEHTEEISYLKDELYRLKRRVRKLEDKDKKAEDKEKDEWSKEALIKQVELERNSYSATKTLLGRLFTKQELMSHSVSGKAPNSKTPAKPKFDGQKYAMFTDIMREKFPSLETKDLTAKVQGVQKSIMRENSKNGKTDTVTQV